MTQKNDPNVMLREIWKIQISIYNSIPSMPKQIQVHTHTYTYRKEKKTYQHFTADILWMGRIMDDFNFLPWYFVLFSKLLQLFL